MKKLALLLAAAGLASATAITFTGNDSGSLFLADATSVNEPSASGLFAHGAAGALGGMCVGIFSNCPTVGGATPDALTFTLASSATLQIQLQDRFQVGDVYDVVLTGPGGTQVFQSSAVGFHGTTVQSCFNATLANGSGSNANSCLNTTTGVLAAGSYSITVWDIVLSYLDDPAGDPFDPSHTILNSKTSGLNPASFAMDLTLSGGGGGGGGGGSVPEPATLGMLGLGGIGLGMLRRYRK